MNTQRNKNIPVQITAHPLTPDRWKDFEAVFMAKGCSIARGCWCMYYFESGKQDFPMDVKPAEIRKERLRTLVETGPPMGLIAYHNDEPVGWVALGPRSAYPKLKRSPIMKPVDDRNVWSVVCFVVPSPWRNKGVAHALLQEAIQYAREQKAPILEAYPVDKAGRGTDEFMWYGTKSMYDKAGFSEVVRRKPERPVMRLWL